MFYFVTVFDGRHSVNSAACVSYHLSGALKARGHAVGICNRARAPEFERLANECRASDALVLMCRPFAWPGRRRLYAAISRAKARRKICYSLAPDSTRVSPGEVKNCNELFGAVLVPSAFGRASMLRSGVKRPIHVVRHGFDPVLFKPIERDFDTRPLRLLYVSTHGMHKDQQVLYDAMALVGGEALLTIKGSSKHRVSDAKGRELPNVRHIYENLPLTELVRLYDKAHVGVLCSHGEGFGMSGLEALATGMPMITTKFGGVLEYATEENALLLDGARVPVDSWNKGEWLQVAHTDLANAIIRLARDRSLLKSKAAAARRSVEGLTWENAAVEFEKAWEACRGIR